MDRKFIVKDFITRCALGDSHAAFAEYAGSGFVHHNPWFAPDADSLALAMHEAALQSPQTRIEVLRILEDGDTLMTHSRVQHAPTSAPYACAHIYRFEGEKIAELWDVAMEVPTDATNSAGAF
ncbi:nuclear transport factor 2 family protein [Luteimonas sp. FXH3W]|uniref:Nuclear transport factor 2 family protein n=1 Tax=Aquilutibacter rugosus TaxID=3115820 RepID=A0ABU7UZF7_9GAMM